VKFRSIVALAFAFALLVPSTALAATQVVTPGEPGWYQADTRPPGTGTFELGPATPPLGSGSFELDTFGSSSEKVQYLTDRYDGVALADVSGIGYSSYRDPASTPGVALVALNLRVDLTGDGAPDAYMVYEPYQDQGNAAIQTGTWQNWDAYRGGAALWWLNTGDGGCGQATPCAWSDIVGDFPGATIEEGTSCGPGNVTTPCPGSLGLNQGSGNAGTISNADALYVEVDGDRTTFDFEVSEPAPSSKDDCKNGGWMTYTVDGEPAFKNQGDCVSSFAPGRNK
jgi:hypothetical protein